MKKRIKKNKAFTLVELLAVIVILALIMGISVFSIGNIINKSKQNSAELSAKAYVDSVNKTIMNNMITGDKINAGDYLINTSGNLINGNKEYIINVDKTKPNDGTIKVNKNIVENATIVIDGYVITYSNGIFGNGVKSNPSVISEIGTRLSLFNTTPGILDNYRIYGNSTQDGTPTPDTPIDVVSLGENGEFDVNVITRGKNLFDVDKLWTNGRQATSTTEQARVITIAVPNGIYTVSTNCPNNSQPTIATIFAGNGQDSLNGFVSSTSGVFTSIAKTITVNTGYLEIGIRNISRDVSGNYLTYDEASWATSGNWIQVEQGSTATDYEPYIAPTTTTIDLTGHEPLRKIGDVSDYIDYENGKIVRNTGKVVFDGTENWSASSMSFFLMYTYVAPTIKPLSICYCSHYLYGQSISIGNNNRPIILDNTFSGNTADFKTWLSEQYAAGTPVTVYYQLAEPVEEDITLPSISVSSNAVIEVSSASKIEVKN